MPIPNPEVSGCPTPPRWGVDCSTFPIPRHKPIWANPYRGGWNLAKVASRCNYRVFRGAGDQSLYERVYLWDKIMLDSDGNPLMGTGSGYDLWLK